MTTFSDALRVPPITHGSIDAQWQREHADTAHLLLDQRTTARDLAAALEGQVNLLRVALASAAAMLDRIDTGGFFTPDELAANRAAIGRALEVTG